MLNPAVREISAQEDEDARALFVNTGAPSGAVALRLLAAGLAYMCLMGIFLEDYTVANTQFDMSEDNRTTYSFGLVLACLLISWVSTLICDVKEQKMSGKDIERKVNTSDIRRAHLIEDALTHEAKNRVAPEGMSWNPMTYYSQRKAISAKVDATQAALREPGAIKERWDIIKAADDVLGAKSNKDMAFLLENSLKPTLETTIKNAMK